MAVIGPPLTGTLFQQSASRRAPAPRRKCSLAGWIGDPGREQGAGHYRGIGDGCKPPTPSSLRSPQFRGIPDSRLPSPGRSVWGGGA